MKKACIIAMAIMMAGLLAGCAAQPAASEDPSDNNTPDYWCLKNVSLAGYRIVYDIHTGVMYNMSSDGVTTLLINADGTPRVWEGWEE